jgi:hypothetical protein
MVIRRASRPLSQADHNLRPIPVAGEVMPVCHHAASVDFAVAREGCARPAARPLWGARSPSRASRNRRAASPAISTWMKRSAKFIVPSLYLRRMAALLLQDGQTPFKERKAVLNVHLTENSSAPLAPQSVAQTRLARIAAALRMRIPATMWPVSLKFCSL